MRATILAVVLAAACGGGQPSQNPGAAADASQAFSAALTIGPHDGTREVVVPIPERPDLDFAVTITPAGGSDPALFLGVWTRTRWSVVLGFAASPSTTYWALDITQMAP